MNSLKRFLMGALYITGAIIVVAFGSALFLVVGIVSTLALLLFKICLGIVVVAVGLKELVDHYR